VLRGRVKLSVHYYEAADLDGIVCVRFFVFLIFGCLMDALGQLTNEYECPVASFHHARETYLLMASVSEETLALRRVERIDPLAGSISYKRMLGLDEETLGHLNVARQVGIVQRSSKSVQT
jgi:hypothetical protein